MVAAQGQALIQAALKLAAQFTQGPVLTGGFDLVKTALIGFLDAQQEDIVGPAEGEGAARLFRHCLDNLKWRGSSLWGYLSRRCSACTVQASESIQSLYF